MGGELLTTTVLAGAVPYVLPLVATFFLGQRYILEGVVTTRLKGQPGRSKKLQDFVGWERRLLRSAIVRDSTGGLGNPDPRFTVHAVDAGWGGRQGNGKE